MSERTAQETRRWTLHGLNNGWLFRTTVRSVTALPRPVSYAIAEAATWISWRLMTETNAAIADNLRAVFPDETERQLRRRALETYRAYARDTIDFLRSISSTPEEAALIFDIPERTSRTLEGLMAEGRGFILVCGHFGNWEIGSTLMHALRLPLTLVAMTEADDGVNRIRREIRERLGADTLEVRQSLDTPLQIRRRLGENRAVALLMDRHMSRDRVEVRLLGRRAWFLRTPAVLARLTGAPLVPCFIERCGPGRFRAEAGDPIYVDAAGDRGEAIGAAAQAFATLLEQRIRARPEHWYHFYRYWDAQRADVPDGAA